MTESNVLFKEHESMSEPIYKHQHFRGPLKPNSDVTKQYKCVTSTHFKLSVTHPDLGLLRRHLSLSLRTLVYVRHPTISSPPRWTSSAQIQPAPPPSLSAYQTSVFNPETSDHATKARTGESPLER
uniref:Uncharacterized protein n=1 Tax=Cacopsylla melanoneura TaxID=428564 RepID=A0A8D8ZE28_9HEMI